MQLMCTWFPGTFSFYFKVRTRKSVHACLATPICKHYRRLTPGLCFRWPVCCINLHVEMRRLFTAQQVERLSQGSCQ